MNSILVCPGGTDPSVCPFCNHQHPKVHPASGSVSCRVLDQPGHRGDDPASRVSPEMATAAIKTIRAWAACKLARYASRPASSGHRSSVPSAFARASRALSRNAAASGLAGRHRPCGCQASGAYVPHRNRRGKPWRAQIRRSRRGSRCSGQPADTVPQTGHPCHAETPPRHNRTRAAHPHAREPNRTTRPRRSPYIASSAGRKRTSTGSSVSVAAMACYVVCRVIEPVWRT
jgi:hypothetical protein